MTTADKKTLTWSIVALFIIVGGLISYFKWGKPYFDKKREDKRAAETDLLIKAQSEALPPNKTAIKEIVGEVKDYQTTFGGQTLIKPRTINPEQ